MQRDDLDIEVWCRKAGPIKDRYRDIGVTCSVTPMMPHVSSLPKFSRNIIAYGKYCLNWPSTRVFRQQLLYKAQEGMSVIHFNHSGLFLLASWLRQRSAIKTSIHIRTHLPENIFSRWQHRSLATSTDQRIYISENEEHRTSLLAGRKVEGTTIYNIVADPKPCEHHSAIPKDSRLKVVALSNYAWVRGTDRLVDIACALARQGRRDILFVVAGKHELSGTLPGQLGELAKQNKTLADYADQCGVGDMFLFLGHIPDPEAVLAAADILVRPSRGRNPWGREILEAMANGVPVLSYGTYDRFVTHDETGILFANFNADQTADALVALEADRIRIKRLGQEARKRIKELCDGPSNARALKAEWLNLAKAPLNP